MKVKGSKKKTQGDKSRFRFRKRGFREPQKKLGNQKEGKGSNIFI